tara:strand:- start:1337 stop:2320 length:984 start_codon:yes stop_codon:yes gene_type:complete
MAYIGKSPDGTGVRSRFYYTQTSGGGTSVTGSSDDGTSLAFSDGAYVDVFLNGVLLVAGTDYNTSTANTIAGLAALANGDVVEVVVYDIFTVADTVSSLNGGTFSNSVTINKASHGDILQIQKEGTRFGALGSQSSGFYIDGETGHSGLRFANGAVTPREDLADADNSNDLGASNNRWANLYLGGGAYIGGTGATNYLDDYEKGTFHVTVDSGISVSSYDHDLGHYVKVGRMVTAWVFIEYNGSSRTSGHFKVAGFPFTSSNDTSNEATFGGFITYQNNFSNAHNIIHFGRNKTKASFYEVDGSDLIGSELSAASGEVRFVVQYTVA